MKTTRKLFVISFFCMTLSSLFLIQPVPAQTVVYNGADTVNFPNFSMYPSEWYEFNLSYYFSELSQFPDEYYTRSELVKGNDTFLVHPPYTPGYGIWGNRYNINDTSGEIVYQDFDRQIVFWNDSAPETEFLRFIPVNLSGEVSRSTLDIVAEAYNSSLYLYGEIYYNINSFYLWNTPTDFIRANFSSDGVLLESEIYSETNFVYTDILMSRPAQLPPVFSFDTTSGLSTVDSRHISLDLTIPAADNNNDGLPDTDYQYRVFESGIWSDWAVVTPFIDYNLGSVPAGNYTLTVEIKNMYGVFQEQIEVEYTPTSTDAIPGYSAVLILIILGFSISILFSRYRKKL